MNRPLDLELWYVGQHGEEHHVGFIRVTTLELCLKNLQKLRNLALRDLAEATAQYAPDSQIVNDQRSRLVKIDASIDDIEESLAEFRRLRRKLRDENSDPNRN